MLLMQSPWLASEICRMGVASFSRLWLLLSTLYRPGRNIVGLVNFIGLECESLMLYPDTIILTQRLPHD